MTIFLEIDCERQLMMTMRLVTPWLDQLQAAIAISRSCLNRGTIPTTIPGTIPTIIPGTIPSTTSSTIPVLPYLVPYPVPYLANITICHILCYHIAEASMSHLRSTLNPWPLDFLWAASHICVAQLYVTTIVNMGLKPEPLSVIVSISIISLSEPKYQWHNLWITPQVSEYYGQQIWRMSLVIDDWLILW